MAPNAPTPEQIQAADAAAAAAMLAVRPVWTDLLPAREALPGLPPRALLHAGPPLPLPCTGPPPMPRPGAPPPVMPKIGPSMTAPMMNSAVVAILFEGWADSVDAARRLVTGGEVEMLAAQDWGVVTPLACVVSPSMVLQVVEDAVGATPAAAAAGADGAGSSGPVRAFSPIQAGAPPAPRFGTLHDLEAHVAKLKRLHGPIAAALRRALHTAATTSGGGTAKGIELLPLAAASLAAGEECHAATTAATAALRSLLQPHLEPAGGSVLSAAEAAAAKEALAFLASAPSLFLNLWMAGCKRVLMAAEGTADSSVVTAVGGNGLMVGVKLAGGDGWAGSGAAAPEPRALAAPVGGAPAPAASEGAGEGDAAAAAAVDAVCGAMGDSMVVDALGFGAQLQPALPLPAPAVASLAAAPGALGLAAHPALSQPGFVPAAGPGAGATASGPVRIGISAASVLAIPAEATNPPAPPPEPAVAEAGGAAVPRRPQPRPQPPVSALAVNLSVLDVKGQLGIVGRGVYRVPREVLQQAVQRLAFVRPRP